jgi:hypothetical protein
MAKVIRQDVWYQEIYPTIFYSEEDLERSIIHNLELIFPQFIAIPFKKDLRDSVNNRTKRADLALIKNDCTEWFVIEVELGGHGITHVVEQIESFKNCNYNKEHAEYIYEKRKDKLDLGSLKQLIPTIPPKLMVIVNQPKPEWENYLSLYDCIVCVFQIYLNQDNQPIYRLNGKHPSVYTGFCHCKLRKDMPYAVKIINDEHFCNSYGITPESTTSIVFNGIASTWERVDSGDEIYLVCNLGYPPLDPSTDRYMLSYNSAFGVFNFSKA